MTALSIIVAIAVAGVLVWLVGLIPMDPKFHLAIRVIAVIALVLWIADGIGAFGHGHGPLDYRLHC